MTKFEVGQLVMITRTSSRGRGEPEEGRVVKVGRTLVTVERIDGWANPIKYHMDTGVQHDDWPISRIDTPEQLAEQTRQREITERLTAAGIRISAATGYGEHGLKADTLSKILLAVLTDRGEANR